MRIQCLYKKGFIALVAILIVSSFALVMSLASGVASYALIEQVNKKEYRMMSKWYARSCMDIAMLELAHDYFAFVQPPGREIKLYFCTILTISGSDDVRVIKTVGHYGGVSVPLEREVKLYQDFISPM
jgi:hypothetical protein